MHLLVDLAVEEELETAEPLANWRSASSAASTHSKDVVPDGEVAVEEVTDRRVLEPARVEAAGWGWLALLSLPGPSSVATHWYPVDRAMPASRVEMATRSIARRVSLPNIVCV
jgi:hypothetical protein